MWHNFAKPVSYNGSVVIILNVIIFFFRIKIELKSFPRVIKCTSWIIRIKKIQVKLNIFLVPCLEWYVVRMSLVMLLAYYVFLVVLVFLILQLFPVSTCSSYPCMFLPVIIHSFIRLAQLGNLISILTVSAENATFCIRAMTMSCTWWRSSIVQEQGDTDRCSWAAAVGTRSLLQGLESQWRCLQLGRLKWTWRQRCRRCAMRSRSPPILVAMCGCAVSWESRHVEVSTDWNQMNVHELTLMLGHAVAYVTCRKVAGSRLDGVNECIQFT
jgi:hypothetical protein